jgi:hypothetical protein
VENLVKHGNTTKGTTLTTSKGFHFRDGRFVARKSQW